MQDWHLHGLAREMGPQLAVMQTVKLNRLTMIVVKLVVKLIDWTTIEHGNRLKEEMWSRKGDRRRRKSINLEDEIDWQRVKTYVMSIFNAEFEERVRKHLRGRQNHTKSTETSRQCSEKNWIASSRCGNAKEEVEIQEFPRNTLGLDEFSRLVMASVIGPDSYTAASTGRSFNFWQSPPMQQ